MTSRKHKRPDPICIRFTRDSISQTFDDGRHLEDTLKELKDGNIDVEMIPRITVVLKDGMHFSVDNRRLWVFREHAKFLESMGKETIEITVKFGNLKMLESSRMTTINEGENVTVFPEKPVKYETVKLSDIRYSTKTLCRFNKASGHYQQSTIYDTRDGFFSDMKQAESLPVLKVVKRRNKLYALDNLQFWLVKQWCQKLNTEDKSPSSGESTENEDSTSSSGNESEKVRREDDEARSHLYENASNRNRETIREAVIYQRRVSDEYISVEGATNDSDSGKHAQSRKDSQYDKDCTLNYCDDHDVRVEFRPYTELPDVYTTKDEGRSIDIVWEEPNKKVVKFKPLTRQEDTQERQRLLKYCRSYEDQSKRRSSRR